MQNFISEIEKSLRERGDDLTSVSGDIIPNNLGFKALYLNCFYHPHVLRNRPEEILGLAREHSDYIIERAEPSFGDYDGIIISAYAVSDGNVSIRFYRRSVYMPHHNLETSRTEEFSSLDSIKHLLNNGPST